MKNCTRLKKNAGITLPEILVGVALLLFILTSALVVEKSFSRGGVSVNNRTRVNSKLRSVSEELRYRASYDFAVMTATPTALQLPNPDIYDRDIKVFAWIGPIDSNNRTRRVELLAKWKEGDQEKSKTSVFSIGLVKAIAPAARARFKVVRAVNPAEGIQNVKIEVHGQNGIRLGFTAADGSLTLDDVYADSVFGASMTVSGIPVCYFNDGGTNKYFLTGPSWRTGPTSPGQTDDTHFVTPIQGYLLSKYKFVVTDDPTNTLVDGARIRIREKTVSNELKIIFPYHPYTSDATTGAPFTNGEAIVSGLPPGDYEAVFLGSPEHPALELLDSHTNFAHQNTLGVEETKVINVQVPKKGAMGGNIKSVSAALLAVPQVSVGANVATSMKLRFYFDFYKVFDPLNVETLMSGTIAADCFRNNQCSHLSLGNVFGNWFDIVLNGGNYLINNITPNFAVRSGALTSNPSNLSTNNNQTSLVSFRPSMDSGATNYFIPAPVTPILVQHKNQTPNNSPAFPPADYDDLKMILLTDITDRFGNPFQISIPIRDTGGGTTAVSDWDVRIKLGGLVTGNNKDIYFLNRDSLANLTGEIRISDGVGGSNHWAPANFSDPGDAHNVAILWYDPGFPNFAGNIPDPLKPWERGFGYVDFIGGDPNKAIIRSAVRVDSDIDLVSIPNKQTYTFAMPGGLPFPLPPNLGQDKTVFKYSAQDATNHTKSFFGVVDAKVKVKRNTGGIISYPQINLPTSQVDIDELTIAYTRLDFGDTTTRNVLITDQLFDPADSWPNNVRSYDTYETWSTPTKLNPGEETNLDVIVPNTPVLKWDRFYLGVTGDTDPAQNWISNFPGFGGPMYQYSLNAGGPGVDGFSGPALEVVLEAKTGLVEGYTKELLASTPYPPIQGVVVFLKRTIRNPDGTQGESQLNTTTDVNGYYSFNNVPYFPYPGNNIQMSYFNVDFGAVLRPWSEGYNYDESSGYPYSENVEVLMIRNGAGGGGGGPGGNF
ncbi:MAG: hypothetical protein ACKVQC_04010 [Elusimicrobiota bacterium]